jgi:hypothetical protein
MAKNSSSQDSASPRTIKFERREVLKSNHYFDNEIVERLLYRYLEGACTDVKLRDEIMEHAAELIRQIIKAHNLGQIYPGKDDSSIGDLAQVAWLQIESALYKYEARPHCATCYNQLRPNDSLLMDEFIFVDQLLIRMKRCPKCGGVLERETIYYRGKSRLFNMWSQIARTVILAYIKKENRDRKNSHLFQEHLENKTLQKAHALNRFITEAETICKYNEDHLRILDAIKRLYLEDDRPHEGLIGKLVDRSGYPRQTITSFLRIVRLRSHEFTDSPINEENENLKDRFQDKEEKQNE